jgi:uncharacterized protein involved in response to NO
MLQPFQVLFPIGLLYAIWGALIWILFLLGWVPYPGQMHAHTMIGGFLFSFALGFLMTAVPRFTGSAPCKRWELQVATALSLFSFLGAFIHVSSLLVLVFLSFFFLSRYRSRSYAPPKHFVFIPVGLTLGIVGSVMTWMEISAGRAFQFQGTMLAFVLGVGGKLISALFGWSDSPLVQISSLNGVRNSEGNGSKTWWDRPPMDAMAPMALLVLGFGLELTPAYVLGRIFRASSATWVAMSAWKLYRRPQIKSRLTNWLWISCWSLVVGVWFYALIPTYAVHALHLMFISGFGLMTIVIASRVTLAHGGYDLEIESRSKAILWASIFIMLAALTRVLAPLTPSYTQHLGYAAGAWIIAMIIWCVGFVPRIAGL